jgi:hypothetical protein
MSNCVNKIVACILIVFAAATTFGAKTSSSATVTGEGDSYWDARQDCVRQALQQTIAQLVIADRRIENDRVIRDSILSTMNGFVDSFEVIKQTSERGKVRLEAKITVSVSGIENFVLSSGKGSAKFDANAVLGNLQRDDLMRASNSEIVSRLFEGFPGRAFEVQVKKIIPDPQKRGFVSATVEIRANMQFIRNLKIGLKTIGHPGRDNHKTPDLLEVCFDSSDGSLSGDPTADCTTVEVDKDSLQQQSYGAGAHIPFAVWFSDPDTAPFLTESIYLQPRRYRYLGSDSPYQELPGYVGQVVFSSRQGRRLLGGAIHITEAVRAFVIEVPQARIPEGAKEIHVVAVFVDVNNQNRALLDLFRPGVSIDSPEFKEFLGSPTGVQ